MFHQKYPNQRIQYQILCNNFRKDKKPNSHSQRYLREACQKKNSGYNEFGTKGGGVSDLNHYLKQL